MGQTLLITLLAGLVVIYILNGRQVVSPSFVACGVFIISAVFYIWGEDYFAYEIKMQTVRVILILLACILAGEIFSNLISKNLPRKELKYQKTIVPQMFVMIVMALFVLVIGVFYYRSVYEFSLKVGNKPGNYLTMAKYVREALVTGTASYDKGVIVSQGCLLSECILYFSIFGFVHNLAVTGKKYWRFFLPILPYILHILATDNRTGLLRTVTICCIIIFCLTKQKSDWQTKGNIKIIFGAVVAILLFLAAFRFLGYRTGVSEQSEFTENIQKYLAASLVGLDQYLIKGDIMPNNLFGEGTLKSIYAILRQWGVPIQDSLRFEEFFQYKHGEANTYTAFKVYLKDYEMAGTMVAMLLWGFIITFFRNNVRRKGANFFRVCMVGMIFYPVAMISIGDVTSSVLSISTLYYAFYLFLLEWLFIKKQVKITV